MVSVHPCDMMWQGTLLLIHGLLCHWQLHPFSPWALALSSGLAEPSECGGMKS